MISHMTYGQYQNIINWQGHAQHTSTTITTHRSKLQVQHAPRHRVIQQQMQDESAKWRGS